MGDVQEDQDLPIILEGVGWKRRSGFGKYSNTVGVGSSWERRRFALTPTKLSYYTNSEDSPETTLLEEFPRGSLTILPERATITATYPGDNSQPTPYMLVIKTTDGISGAEITKWKVCVDDRETQLIWLVALTDIVADASVKEYNAKVLAAEIDKSVFAGGFHRLYEEGDGRLLDLVHNALMLSSVNNGKRPQGDPKSQEEGIEVVQRSKEIHGMDDNATFTSGDTTSPVAVENQQLPVENLHKALAVVFVCLVYENWAQKSTAILWQLVTAIILGICFYPSKSKNEKKEGQSKGASNESNAMQSKNAPPVKQSNTTAEVVVVSPLTMSKSTIGTELLKAERVPLSDMPSGKFSSEKKSDDDAAPLRIDPLTEHEMGAHLHERWAMAAPTVDLSGEWTLIADDTFKSEYDAYLKQLGFSGITRRVACSLIARTTEVTKQLENGRGLFLKGTNPKGAWERTLTSSGYPDFETQSERKEGEDYSHSKSSIKTADSEDVDAEAWWEERGTKHRSWLRGGKKYGGGDFESVRYLEEGSDGSVLVCESFFHPKDKSKKTGLVTWRFQRD